jgi:hypothetical protein
LRKYEYASANFAETCAWGGWLRAAETFSLDDEDVEIVTSANGCLHNFPIGVGEVLMFLWQTLLDQVFIHTTGTSN